VQSVNTGKCCTEGSDAATTTMADVGTARANALATLTLPASPTPTLTKPELRPGAQPEQKA
jgi:hypothetical protein